jgi:alkylation response protein AidB-like acyl-CoA dehydrogenase
MESVLNKTILKGGEWMIKESSAEDIFIREDFTEEQQMILDMCRQFVQTEVHPIIDRIDKLEPGLMRSLLMKAGEQGLLSTSFPQE